MFFGAKKILGLDIGSSTIKMAELEVGRNSAQLVSFGFVPTPVGAIGGGEINNVAVISDAIKSLYMQIKAKRKNVNAGLWGTSVIVKKITMPKVEKKLIAQQVRWESEQYIPFDPNEISLDHHLLKLQTGADTLDLLIIAGQNAMINQYQQAIVSAGLKLSILDVSGFALANTFELNYGKQASQTISLLNIGANVTNFVVVHDGEVIFARDIPYGGANYTLEIHKEMGVTIPEAEALKLSAATGNEVPEQVHAIMSSVTDAMVEEIRNSFEFFAASTAGFNVTKCFYTGGGSQLTSLIKATSHSTAIPFEPLNPFIKVKGAKGMSKEYIEQVAPYSSIVLGLGLRKVGD